MVSFSPESIINQDKEFCKEALAFEEKLDEEYRDEAPLFCDGESLFKLSSDAEILSRNQASISFKKVNDESSIKMDQLLTLQICLSISHSIILLQKSVLTNLIIIIISQHEFY